MTAFCGTYRCLNFKTDNDYCTECNLTYRQKKKLYSQCIECIEIYDSPEHKCEHVKKSRRIRINKRLHTVPSTCTIKVPCGFT